MTSTTTTTNSSTYHGIMRSCMLLSLLCINNITSGVVGERILRGSSGSGHNNKFQVGIEHTSRKLGTGAGDRLTTSSSTTTRTMIKEPPISGIMPGIDRPKIILAQDIDYPPYAKLGPANEDFPLSGFGYDFAIGMQDYCNIDIFFTQTAWSECWDGERIGNGLASGQFHGCPTYTHPLGVRNRFLEFSDPILSNNKAAGILTRLDPETGEPVIDGNSNLNGVKIVDVVGFAPSMDNLATITNKCTDEKFQGYKFIEPTVTSSFPNDDALQTLLKGDADAMWVYADEAEQLSCANNENPAWNCTMWDQLGKDFAYIQTGSFEFAVNGTTLSISKIGSGLPDILNPCISAFLPTEEYYKICEKYNLTGDCYENEYFPCNFAREEGLYNYPTNNLPTNDCTSGYCPCPV